MIGLLIWFRMLERTSLRVAHRETEVQLSITFSVMWGLLLNCGELIEDLFGSVAKIYIFLHVSLEVGFWYGLLAIDHFLHVPDRIKTFFFTIAVILLHLQVGYLQGFSVKVRVVLVMALE